MFRFAQIYVLAVISIFNIHFLIFFVVVRGVRKWVWSYVRKGPFCPFPKYKTEILYLS